MRNPKEEFSLTLSSPHVFVHTYPHHHRQPASVSLSVSLLGRESKREEEEKKEGYSGLKVERAHFIRESHQFFPLWLDGDVYGHSHNILCGVFFPGFETFYFFLTSSCRGAESFDPTPRDETQDFFFLLR